MFGFSNEAEGGCGGEGGGEAGAGSSVKEAFECEGARGE